MKKNINTIKNISVNIPKTINEAINYDMDYIDEEMDIMDEPESFEEPVEQPIQKEQEIEMGAEELISDIRKKALKAMANLADTPEDPNYEVLKKIFMMLEKAVTEKQEQREVMAKNSNADKI